MNFPIQLVNQGRETQRDVATFKPVHAPNKPVQLFIKRLIDIIASILLIVFFLPLLIAISLVIWLEDRGPVFFSQPRLGRNNQIFTIWKFRTMRLEQSDVSGVTQTVSEDPRITAVGRLLRRSNLDELPQLWNILIGDMALVGPRPHVEHMKAAGSRYEDMVPGYHRRHVMKPGLTGLAQCRGLRGPTTDLRRAKRRVYNDLVYIRRFSLVLDCKIVIKTLQSEIFGGTGF